MLPMHKNKQLLNALLAGGQGSLITVHLFYKYLLGQAP
jgi:hypothetical protein